MENTQTKPRFEEIIAVTMKLPDEGLVFNAQRVGPMNFNDLRNANYGEGFRMPTIPEIVPLVYASLENQDHDTAKNVVEALEKHWISGNTAVHYFPKGMFAEDIPKMKSGRIVTPTFKVLESSLGSHEEGGVSFSDDESVRFTPYGFVTKMQSALELSKNPGIIALVGSEENAEKLARVSKHYKLNPYFRALENIDLPKTRVADLGRYSFGYGLDFGACDSENFDRRCSFGVLE